MSPIVGIFASANTTVAGSYESIATANGTGSSNTITFSSIPSGYQHLQLRYIGKSTQNATATYAFTIRLNGDTGSNYSRHRLSTDGAIVTSAGFSSQTAASTVATVIPGNLLTSIFGVGIIDIEDYRSTAKNKVIRGVASVDTNRATSPTGTVDIFSSVWFATPAAVTSIDLILATGSWSTTSTFALYGIKG